MFRIKGIYILLPNSRHIFPQNFKKMYSVSQQQQKKIQKKSSLYEQRDNDSRRSDRIQASQGISAAVQWEKMEHSLQTIKVLGLDIEIHHVNLSPWIFVNVSFLFLVNRSLNIFSFPKVSRYFREFAVSSLNFLPLSISWWIVSNPTDLLEIH